MAQASNTVEASQNTWGQELNAGPRFIGLSCDCFEFNGFRQGSSGGDMTLLLFCDAYERFETSDEMAFERSTVVSDLAC